MKGREAAEDGHVSAIVESGAYSDPMNQSFAVNRHCFSKELRLQVDR